MVTRLCGIHYILNLDFVINHNWFSDDLAYSGDTDLAHPWVERTESLSQIMLCHIVNTVMACHRFGFQAKLRDLVTQVDIDVADEPDHRLNQKRWQHVNIGRALVKSFVFARLDDSRKFLVLLCKFLQRHQMTIPDCDGNRNALILNKHGGPNSLAVLHEAEGDSVYVTSHPVKTNSNSVPRNMEHFDLSARARCSICFEFLKVLKSLGHINIFNNEGSGIISLTPS